MGIKCLRSVFSSTIRERIRNEVIRRRVGVQSDLMGKVEKCVLRWVGLVERMVAKRVYGSGVDGRRGRDAN